MLCQSRQVIIGICLLLLWISPNVQARSLPDFVELAKENSPSVVNISTKQRKTTSNRFRHNFRIPDVPEDSPLNEFFERFSARTEEMVQVMHRGSTIRSLWVRICHLG